MKRAAGILGVAVGMLLFCADAAAPLNPEEGTSMKMSDREEARLVIFGASYAKGWTPETLAGYQVVTKGVSGEQAHEMLARFDTDVVGSSPKAVIIWGFINGFHRTPQPDWERQKQTIRSSIEEMVSIARQHDIEAVLATEVTIRGKDTFRERVMALAGRLLGKKSYQDLINEEVLATNAWLREYAAREGLQLLDLQPLVSDKRGVRIKKYATPDGSHISAEAYQKFTEYAEKTLRSSAE